MNLLQLAKDIQHLNYVVMRNWEELPPTRDLDLFVHPDHYLELKEICRSHLPQELFDIFTEGDNYYSPYIERIMLEMPRGFQGFKIPNERAHFLSLYYHGKIHKGDDRYDKKLEQIFWDWMQPRPPRDPGVGFHDISKN